MIKKSENVLLNTPFNTLARIYNPRGAQPAANATPTTLSRWASIPFWLPVLVGASLILWLVFWLRLQNLMVSEWGYDQGYYLLVAHMMDKGFAPYREIHMDQPPGMVWSAYLPLRLFGSIWGMRFVMLGFTLVAVASTIGIGRRLGGPLAGLLAGGLLIFSDIFFGITVDPGIPSVSLALVAIVLALDYRVSRKPVWLGLSALAMAGSLLMKLYMPLVLPLVILIIYLAQQNRDNALKNAQFLRHAFLWLAIVGLVTVGVYLSYGLSALLDQTVFFHLKKSQAHPWTPWADLVSIVTWFLDRPLFLLVSLYSLGLAWVQLRRFGWIILVWFLLAVIYLVVLNPLRSKHLVMLVPLQAVLIGLALSHWLSFKAGSGQALTWGIRALGLALTPVLLTQTFFTFTQWNRPHLPLVAENKQPIVELLEKFTTPADCIITDDPYVAITSGRLPPPWLANLAYARFESRSLPTEDLKQITESYGCQVVVPTFERLKNSDRAYYDWAKEEYLQIWVVDGKEIMLGKPLTEVHPMQPAQAEFQDQVTLMGMDWVLDQPPDNRRIYLSLYWQTLKPFNQGYKIFVHLRDAAGQTVANADHEVFGGLLPTQAWPPGRIVKDTQQFSLPNDIPAGDYTLYVGLYDPATLERLPLVNDSSGENAALFSGITLP